MRLHTVAENSKPEGREEGAHLIGSLLPDAVPRHPQRVLIDRDHLARLQQQQLLLLQLPGSSRTSNMNMLSCTCACRRRASHHT